MRYAPLREKAWYPLFVHALKKSNFNDDDDDDIRSADSNDAFALDMQEY